MPDPSAEGIEGTRFAARKLLDHDPDSVARSVDRLRGAADADRDRGTPRGKAYVRRLQELLIERPELGLAVAESIGLAHIAEDLLAGVTVDGVEGIGADGTALAPSRRTASRRRGRWIILVSAGLLLLEAVTADSLPSALLYGWTAIGLGLFFVGGYLVLNRD
jgi:hypothetical protein